MDVSVIVVNWNTRDLLRDCLKSVYEHTSQLEFEIIVVDNASTDDSCEMVHGLFPQIILIANDTNKGYAAALNQGMRVAQGRYFLILNSDTLICNATIEKTIGYADDHPEAAVIGCQVWEDEETIQMTCFSFPGLLNLVLSVFGFSRFFKYNRFFGREWMLWWRRDEERQVDVVSGMYMLVNKQAIEQVGLMSEDYFLYFEETDWCYRFAQAGWKSLFWPGAKIMHMHGGSHSTRQAELAMFIQLHKSNLIYLKKHKSRFQYAAGRLLLLVSVSLRMFGWLVCLMLKMIRRRKIDSEWRAVQMNWATFKFYTIGLEPNKSIR